MYTRYQLTLRIRDLSRIWLRLALTSRCSDQKYRASRCMPLPPTLGLLTSLRDFMISTASCFLRQSRPVLITSSLNSSIRWKFLLDRSMGQRSRSYLYSLSTDRYLWQKRSSMPPYTPRIFCDYPLAVYSSFSVNKVTLNWTWTLYNLKARKAPFSRMDFKAAVCGSAVR